jgi:beta-galactosidase/beta-glucuronidase
LALAVNPGGARAKAAVSWQAGGGEFTTEVSLGESARTWDEFNPTVYQLTATLDGAQDSRTVAFGLRDISTQGTQFVLNGHKVFLRGTLECAIFPRTGYPPTDVEAWRRVIRTAKAHGLNNIRFHSWCPPEAAFTAADELGFYYLVECSSWANGTSSLGDGKPVDAWIYQEADRIIRAYGNHPSFLLMAYGNEPGGEKSNAYLAKWVDHYKAADLRDPHGL